MPDLNMIDQLTALEVMRRTKNNDGLLMVESMASVNELLLDAPAFEANDGAINNSIVRTSYRAGTKRKYNEGIGHGSTESKTLIDRIAMLEDYSVVDAALAEHTGVAQLRNSEAQGFLLGMGETQADDFIYGDYGADHSEINGLATRLNSTTDVDNVFSCAGASACTSIYVVSWGRKHAHLIYPKGRSDCGIHREDRGKQDWPMPNSKVMPAYVDFFSVHYGLAIEHPNAVKRICNITSATTADTIIDKICEAMYKLPPGATNITILANSDMLVKIDKAGRDKNNVVYTKEDPWGRPINWVRTGRLRRMDSILSFSEGAVGA